MMIVKGKVIVITGGTQGLGKEVAFTLANAGAAGLVLTGRNHGRGEQTAGELKKQGCEVRFIAGDLTKEADCRRIIPEALSYFGGVHGLVNAAGTTDRGSLEEINVEAWDHIFSLNVRGAFILMQDTVRAMKQAGGGGSIVNILSDCVHGGPPELAAYSASKGALAVLTKNAANAHKHDKIRINGINMGWTLTDHEDELQKQRLGPDWLKQAEATQPFGRIMRPSDIAGLVLYLLSDASQMMTGALIDFNQHVIGC